MKYPRGRLIQFARYPRLGRVKTRLQGALSTHQVLRLHCQLVRHTNRVLSASRLAPLDLWYGADSAIPADDDFLSSLEASAIFRQRGADLGERMCSAFADTLRPWGSASAAVLVGSDCPFLDAAILAEAMAALAGGVPLVLGPALDGGYYLIGLSLAAAGLFDDMPWGTDQVLARTLERAAALGLDCQLLPTLADIDVAADLEKLAEKPEYAWLFE